MNNQEVQFVVAELKRGGAWNDLFQLMKPRTLSSLTRIGASIVMAILAAFIAIVHPPLIPVLILVIARSIRSIGNHCHDVMHSNIFRQKKHNYLFGKYFLMPLLWYDYELYTREHTRHHAYLGSPDQDPDFIRFKPRIEAADGPTTAFLKVLRPMLFDRGVWIASLFGDLPRMKPPSCFLVLANWLFILLVVCMICGLPIALMFLGLWILTRATSYHAIKVFAELCDHAFLPPGSITMYTRTMPTNFLAHLFHPENDSFHTAHHLFPKIPIPNLRKAHRLLLRTAAYQNSQHLTTYFTGKNSVLKALTGRLAAGRSQHNTFLNSISYHYDEL